MLIRFLLGEQVLRSAAWPTDMTRLSGEASFHCFDDGVSGDAEIREKLTGRGRFAEAINADHGALEADILVPAAGRARFYRDARDTRWQHGRLPVAILPIENVGRRHGHDTCGNAEFL